jgi:uncharacterized protein YecE (DUF72 family)
MWRTGTSGWRYPPWRGTFYPKGLAQRRELEYLSRAVSSIEINGSFYSIQTAWPSWRAQVPEDFLFSVKGPRFVTHMKQLNDVRVPVANFLASGLLALGPTLGPVLWQLPPRMILRPERMRAFLELLPRTTAEAAELGKEHDERIANPVLETVDRPMRHAVEVRNESFRDLAFVALLREFGVSLVVADTAGKWPFLTEVTADLVYCRLHGARGPRRLGDEDPRLARAGPRRPRLLRQRRQDPRPLRRDRPRRAARSALKSSGLLRGAQPAPSRRCADAPIQQRYRRIRAPCEVTTWTPLATAGAFQHPPRSVLGVDVGPSVVTSG